jgi:Mn-dependent DtxR family transcriptional regulator
LLNKLLKLILEDGILSTTMLAKQLGVSKAFVEAMILELVRAGYLQQVEGCQSGVCPSCNGREGCKPMQRTWITVKRTDPQ